MWALLSSLESQDSSAKIQSTFINSQTHQLHTHTCTHTSGTFKKSLSFVLFCSILITMASATVFKEVCGNWVPEWGLMCRVSWFRRATGVMLESSGNSSRKVMRQRHTQKCWNGNDLASNLAKMESWHGSAGVHDEPVVGYELVSYFF